MLDLLVAEGLITTEPIRKYHLLPASLEVIKKTYATSKGQAYAHRFTNLEPPAQNYYLTPFGLNWLFSTLAQYSYQYLRSIYPPYFMEEEQPLSSLKGLNNFRGTSGRLPKAGTKQAALLIHRYKRVERKYEFKTIREARAKLYELSRFYPLEDFTIYRVRPRVGREKIPLIGREYRDTIRNIWKK